VGRQSTERALPPPHTHTRTQDHTQDHTRHTQVAHVLFTEPEVVEAGQEVAIWYDPTYTVLAGSKQVRVGVLAAWVGFGLARPWLG
jgi:hypothetical protein